MKGSEAFWIPFFGFLGACATVSIPLLIRHYFNLASKREDEQDELARNYQVASDFIKRLYPRYIEDHTSMALVYEGQKKHREKHPDEPIEMWEYTLYNLSTRPIMTNEFQEHLNEEAAKKSQHRRKSDEE